VKAPSRAQWIHEIKYDGYRIQLRLYFAFDLLWLDGKDLRGEPQIERKKLLKELIEEHELNEPVFYSEHHEGDGQALFAAAGKLNYEGIVSKRVDAPYRSEWVEAWQKIKVVQKGKFPWSAS
jgi:bifunctional non-homologous end joining protein LigD